MFKRVSTLIIIFFIFTVFLEQGIRFYIFGFRSFNFTLMNSAVYTDLAKDSLCLDLPYELRPNLDTFFKLARFRTNSDGLRDKEYQIKKPENTFRVVVLGASITMGAGVDIDETFHSLLENRLNSESSNTSYEFINFGVGGYNPPNYLTMLRYKALKYEPDLILFCTDARKVNKANTKLKYKKRKIWPFFHSYVLEFARKNKVLSFFDKKKKTNSGIAQDRDNNNKTSQLEILENIFLQLRAISKQHNVPICVVRDNFYFYRVIKEKEMKKLALKYGLYYVDTSHAFRKKKVMDCTIYKIDPHPSAAAHNIVAPILYDYLKKKRLLDQR